MKIRERLHRTSIIRAIRESPLLIALILLFSTHIAFCAGNLSPRRIISLDGTWEIAEGGMDSPPRSFEHKVPVPGLVDMAEPPFLEVGKKIAKREAFWYRRTFKVAGTIPDVAILKIYKAKYGTQVFLNGKFVGEHLPCFTPALLDVKEFLKGSGRENELVVRVGANRESVPDGQPSGWDFEKYLYVPGIYDSVELILTGSPYISNIQTVPDTDKNEVGIFVELNNVKADDKLTVRCAVREARSGKMIASTGGWVGGRHKQVPFSVPLPIRNARLWSPEDPFLYEVEINTVSDQMKVRFGMRSFRFDRESGRAILNGKPYYMRGTNVCAYRFFEDAERGDKPWRAEWVRRLHRKFKSMHWNSIRYCIGFPPEIWYDIADELGFLIQDEFPIWLLNRAPEHPVSDKIIPEYTEWMRERWNHPCVVIWDAQNESVADETGKAVQAVRSLDLSNRPWENGWAEPQSADDCVESHPYLFIKTWSGNKPFRFSDIADISGVPRLRDAQKKHDVPIIINEYAWLWLNRDGTPTTLTKKIYDNLFPQGSTTEQRRLRYARYLAALTEFWRCNRECAGVLHFCGLGYSRPGDKPRPEGGATSDHFIDLERLTLEPYFEQYVRDAFSPVGLMIDFWDEELTSGIERQFKVFVINDLHRNWKGTVRLRIIRDIQTIAEQARSCTVSPFERKTLTFEQEFPKQRGEYQLVADLVTADGKIVRSLRDFEVVPAGK